MHSQETERRLEEWGTWLCQERRRIGARGYPSISDVGFISMYGALPREKHVCNHLDKHGDENVAAQEIDAIVARLGQACDLYRNVLLVHYATRDLNQAMQASRVGVKRDVFRYYLREAQSWVDGVLSGSFISSECAVLVNQRGAGC